MNYFCDFYRRVFDFREHQYFDITGEYTGLTSRVLAGPCGKIRIPINESKCEEGSGEVDQIQEFIQQYTRRALSQSSSLQGRVHVCGE